MAGISNHTRLINCVIGFTRKIPEWPSPLRNLGFAVDWIEPRLVSGGMQVVNADVMVSSNRLGHSLVVECKGGSSVDSGQLAKYASLDVAAVRNRCSLREPQRMSFEVFFVCQGGADAALHAAMAPIRQFPLLAVDPSQVRLVDQFSLSDINNEFATPLPAARPPISFYPFGDEDLDDYVARFVLQELVSLAVQRIGSKDMEVETEALLSRIHPLWGTIDVPKRAKLKGKVDRILAEYQKTELRGYLERVKRRSSWHVVKSLQAFTKEAQRVLDNLSKQSTLPV